MAKFYLTSRAIHDLMELEEFSISQWGENQTSLYINEMYVAFSKIAKNPAIGKLRRVRTYPLYLAPVKKHFVVYHPVEKGIIIATILHGRRNIEGIIKSQIDRLSYEVEERVKRIK